MKLSVLVLALAFSCGSAQAAPNWEVCLDDADFTLSVSDSFLNFLKLTKSGCVMRFLTMGGKGEKLEVNLCDANIHVDQYSAIDATDHSTYYAGSAGCPAPMFGADFNERADDLQKYDQAKARVMSILANVNKTYGKNLEKIDLSTIKKSDLGTSEAKTACANYLIKQYLEKCTSFEERKSEPAPIQPLPIPAGVHPETIKK